VISNTQVDAPNAFRTCIVYSRAVSTPVGVYYFSLRCRPHTEFQDEPDVAENYDDGEDRVILAGRI